MSSDIPELFSRENSPGVSEWVDALRREKAFQALRKLDEEMCVSANYIGCCDAHALPGSEQ